MPKDNQNTMNKKLTTWIAVFKNVKFIVFNILFLIVLAVAFLSGDGRQMALDFYAKVTGQQLETFEPVDNAQLSNERYLILKHKLLQDKHVRIEDVDVRVFKESATSYKYRVPLSEAVFIYTIKKNASGIWQINTTRK
jgi:hypothetical protein